VYAYTYIYCNTCAYTQQADAARKEFAEVNAGLLRGLAERDQQVVSS
jgi:hypothetical protein